MKKQRYTARAQRVVDPVIANLRRRWEAAVAHANELEQMTCESSGQAYSAFYDAEIVPLIGQIERLHCGADLDGLRLKARVAKWCCCGELPDCELDATTDERMLSSIVRELLPGWQAKAA